MHSIHMAILCNYFKLCETGDIVFLSINSSNIKIKHAGLDYRLNKLVTKLNQSFTGYEVGKLAKSVFHEFAYQ